MSSTLSRVMEISTPLDPHLLFHAMHAREEMSRLSEYQVSLLSLRPDLDLNEILGKKITVKLALPDDSVREFNGYVTRIAQHGTYGRYHRYAAIVRPWLWFLTRTSDCRIFQDMTVPEIIEAVFGDHPTADYKLELTGSYRTWTYCVQYRETDFNFVSRLMEHEGIYYYFRHADGQNQMVVTDSYSGHEHFPEYTELPIVGPDRLVRPDLEHIATWEFSREVQPGVFAHTDYDLERPTVELLAKKTAPRPYACSDYEVYDYPGHYVKKPDGEQYAAVRIDEFGSRFETVEATTNARGVAVGYLLDVVGHAREDQNREYLITAASYDLEFSDYEAMPDRGGASYKCSFVAMSSQQQFRPRRITPKPFVQGPQTAVVVGPAGEEIHSEKFAQVKVQFHWDRYGKRDENSSCWIRVVQPWAGKGWGSVVIPRIGHEVMVEFIEGDPDQPIVTGSVYNGENAPPYPQPGSAVVSGLKSNTHKGKGFNEMSMDDTAGKEKITIHAQYDMSTTVLHDQTNTINNNRTTKVVVDDALNVDANRTVHVKAKHKETVDGGQEVTVSSGYKETITGGATSEISGGLTSTVNGKWDNTVNGHLKEVVTSGAEQEVTGTQKITVTGAIDQSATGKIDIHAGAPGTYTSDASLKLAVAGSVIEITPGGITISMGGSSVKVDPAGVSLTGPKISLNG
jgi:type VI secretion system secreted protein VgrG